MDSGSPPSPPDPAQLTQQQAEANRIDTYTPYGSVTYSGPNRNVMNVSLSDDQAQILGGRTDITQAMLQRGLQGIGQFPDQPLSYQGLPDYVSGIDFGNLPAVNRPQLQGSIDTSGFVGISPVSSRAGELQRTIDARSDELQRTIDARSDEIQRGIDARTQMIQRGVDPRTNELQRGLSTFGLTQLPGTDDFGAERSRVEQATFDRARHLLQPDFDLRREATVQELADRGIPVGSEAYKDAIGGLERERNRALTDAAYSGILAGGGEQSRLFGLASSARGQEFGERATAGDFTNRATQQAFNQGLGAGEFANRAVGQIFGQDLGAGQFRNTATGQAFQQDLGAGQFRNAATGQAFQQDLGAGQFRNAATGQAFQQDVGATQANAALRQQQLQEALGLAGFANDIALQNYGIDVGERQRVFGEGMSQANMQNAARLQGINEREAQRSRQFNELAALLGGQQVQLPQGPAPATIDVVGPAMAAYQGNLAAYNNAQQSRNAALGGLFGLGSSAILGFSGKFPGMAGVAG